MYKNMIKSSIIVVMSVCLIMICLNVSAKGNEINNILSQKDYSNLPDEAKEYIKDAYEETGNIILTEKNKKENVPYLNPKYVEYLELTDEEKEKIEFVPETFILDYVTNSSYSNSSFPTSYDLRTVNGKNFVTPIKNQGSTEICWAFASIENVETLLLKNSGQSYSDSTPKFSIRQIDYATATDKLIEDYTSSAVCTPTTCSYYVWENTDNGSRKLGKGGNFFTSSIIMANGLTLVDESVLPWNEDDVGRWPKEIFSYDNSQYEVNSTIQMPTINEDHAPVGLINNYVSDIKRYMMQYGGPFVGTYSPTSTCGFENIDGTIAMKTDDCANDTSNRDKGHAMQIIGWDDNYEYSYCDDGTKHYAVEDNNCTSGELTQGKGAWILRNSWGEDTEEGNIYKYVYLTYDSTRLSIGFTTSVSKMENRTWDNNYHSNPWIDSDVSNGMMSIGQQTKKFDIHNNKPEKIEKIKFIAASKNGSYTLSIDTGKDVYNNIATINSEEVGIYTIDLSNKNIVIDNNNFTVTFTGNNNSKFYNDSISIFTSNVDSSPYAITYSPSAYNSAMPISGTNPLYVSGDNYWYLTVNTYLKNIPSNADLTYRIKKDDGVIATERQIADFKKTIINDFGEAKFSGFYSSSNSYFSTSEAYGKTYTFEVVYDDIVVDSFPIKFSGKGETTKSNIRLYANNGTDYYYDTQITDKTTSTFKLSSINSKNFYNNGYYITSWNTKADGTGESYSVDEAVSIYHDMELYAQWSNETLDVKFNFKCKYSDNCSGTMNSITVDINDNITFPENSFTKDGYKFTVWAIDDRNNNELKLYEQEKRSVSQILRTLQISYNQGYFVFNNMEIEVDAYWSNNSKTITFDSNGGTGNMKSMNFEPKVIAETIVSQRIKDNLFTKEGYTFTSWNTASDGSGTSYTNFIQTEDDIILYAQWELSKYHITFDANGGSGTLGSQEVIHNVSTNLSKNTYSKEGYTFVSWNTASDGSGTSYADEQSISLTNDLTLYAQWEINKYHITFNANGGNGYLDSQEVYHNVSAKLSKNTYSKEGYTFVSWNTKSDGSGYLYVDEQSVSLISDITLYAQWEINKYHITFDANGGSGTLEQQEVSHNIATKLSKNTYTKEEYIFAGWNTKLDGSGTSYADEQNISLTGNITLYAQWVKDIKPIQSVSIISITENNNAITLEFNNDNSVRTYEIYRSNYKTKSYKKIAETNSNNYTNTGLTYGKTYYYKVIAKNELYKSGYSNIVSKYIKPNKTTLKITSAGTNNIKIAWDKVSVTGYQIQRSTNGKKWSTVKTITKNSTLSFNNTRLSSNKKYYYRIRAYKKVSGRKIYGSWSTVVSTKTAPVKPSLKVTLKDYNAMNIAVGSSKGATKYIVERSLDGKTYTLFDEITAKATLAGLDQEAGKTYYFRVRACNSENRCSSWVTKSLKQTTKVPSFTLKTTSKKVTITLTSVNGADGYQIYRSTSRRGKYSLIKEFTTEDELLQYINNTTKGRTYYYKVRSYKIVNESRVYSAYSSIKNIRSK